VPISSALYGADATGRYRWQKRECWREDVRQQNIIHCSYGSECSVFYGQRLLEGTHNRLDHILYTGVGSIILRRVLGLRILV
jgi:predicted NUDIX family phosphoesterase